MQTSKENVGAGGIQEEFAAPIAQLEPIVTYHYQLVCENSVGRSVGADREFTTPPVEPAVNDRPLFTTGVASHEATLHGTVDPGKGITTYHFVYGETAAYGSSTAEAYTELNYEDDPVEQLVTGLQAGVTVHYALVATNASGTTVGPDEQFTTLEGIRPPAAETSGPSMEVISIPSFGQPATPVLLPTVVFPAITPVKRSPSPKCKKGFVRKSGKCVKRKPAKVKKRRK